MLLVLAVLLFVANPQRGSAPVSADPDEMVEIDGKKNPELIPQWKAWEAAFDLLAAGKRGGAVQLDRELEMSEADKALVYAEAARHVARWNAHKKQVLEELEPLLAKMKREELLPRNRAMILEYRQQVLDGSQRLLQRLSPEGRERLPQWVEQLKASITVTAPKSELEFFRRPY